ncbi:hypothetical protein DBV15_03490 [Temnothorax longispinosus]|uniref:Uncharacterized protein n=1 Tax=Temnothorax longispinosus TaxID=300112 RepID=A0A4S2KZ44_9HYME|nr:hypothetical protein DBV15_03490 [Temnothorax longispinosus]
MAREFESVDAPNRVTRTQLRLRVVESYLAADFFVDFSEVVAIEVENSQCDEISESAIIHSADVISGQTDEIQIGEPGKSADYNVRHLFNPRKAPLGKSSSRLKSKSRRLSSVNPAKESGATEEILLSLSKKYSSPGLRFEKDSASIASISLQHSPANESFGIKLILLEFKFSNSRCPKSANKYPDNGTILSSK